MPELKRPQAIVSIKGSQKFIRACIYGDPGVGKTPFIGTGLKTLILDADNGVESASILGSTAERWRIRDHGDMAESLEYLRHQGFRDYKWAWLDGITLFQERGLDEIMRTLVADKPHRKVYLPDKGEFGQNMNRIKLWFREFVDIPMNVGFTAHALKTEDDEGQVVYMPAVQGRNMPDVLCGYMNIVGYMYAHRKEGKIERVLRVQKDAKHYAKDRFNAVPGGKMVSPSIPRLEALVRAKVGVPSTPAKKAVAAKKVAPTKRSRS